MAIAPDTNRTISLSRSMMLSPTIHPLNIYFGAYRR
jgi:hypothetical protein